MFGSKRKRIKELEKERDDAVKQKDLRNDAYESLYERCEESEKLNGQYRGSIVLAANSIKERDQKILSQAREIKEQGTTIGILKARLSLK